MQAPPGPLLLEFLDRCGQAFAPSGLEDFGAEFTKLRGAWPTRPQALEFAGFRIWIVPITTGHYPGVALRRCPDLTQEGAEKVLYRFLSVLSWREEGGIAVASRSGGNLPRMMGLAKQSGFAIREEFDFTELICPEEEEPRIALALMREGLSLNHHGYAFLSYWRVLELAFPKASARVAWMTSTIPTLSRRGVTEATASIVEQGVTDVGRHLFDSGRCAIAHATSEPIINPDDPGDAMRLYRELPLVRAIAIRAIEDRFGILSPTTEYQQHLYELRGWKKVLGGDLVANVVAGVGPTATQMIDLPKIHVRLRECPPYRPFENMTAKHFTQRGDELLIMYGTEDGLADIRFRLAPAEERLRFDVDNGLYGHDDGSVTASEYKRESRRFIRDYLLNGELQVWNAETGELLSRLDPFMPLNMMIDLKGCNASIAEAEKELQSRQMSNAP